MAMLSGWQYRKSITISRASGAVTDYQLKIKVGESSGASGADVDCGGKCLSSFDDLRFTTSDGTTLLNYWIESITGTTPNQLATVWVKFDSIGTSATTFYMYYGNASASAVSSGAGTFITFEDFEWGADEDNLTTSGGSVTWTAVQGVANIDAAQPQTGTRSGRVAGGDPNPIYSMPLAASDNISIHFSAFRGSADVGFPYVEQGNGSKFWGIRTYASELHLYYYGSSLTETSTDVAANTWHRFEINNFNYTAGTYSIWLNDVNIVSSGAMQTSSAANNILRFRNGDYAYNGWYDNIFICNYRSTGPAFGTWGTEEAAIIVAAGELSATPALSAGAIGAATVTVAVAGTDLSAAPQLSAGDVAIYADTNYSITYRCRLTPAAGNELTLPISSFQGRFRTGTPSYLSVVVPGLDLSAAIAATMTDPENPPSLAVDIVKTHPNGNAITEVLMAVDVENAAIYEGGTSQTIVLTGHRTTTFTVKAVTLTGASYRNVNAGKTRYRCTPHLYLRPGDTVTVNGETFTADEISMAISVDSQTMEVAQA